jgi:hypothetical protein
MSMPTYTVHAPPSRNGSAADPQRFVFVRDGFHAWAFLLGPVWLLAHRLWLVLLGYVALSIAMSAAFYFSGAPAGARFLIGLLLAILVGLEAATLRRWTYGRRRWTTLGVVNADDEESAERRFFAEWVKREPPSLPSPPAVVVPRAPVATDIIGLFPEPGGRP